MENIIQDQCEKDWDETRAKVRENIAKNVKILKKFDDKYDTNLGQWYDNESDTLDDNLDEEYQSEAFYIEQEVKDLKTISRNILNIEQEDKDLKTIDVNSPIGPPNPANLELQ